MLMTDAGQVSALNAAAGVPATAVTSGGWAKAATGGPYVEDLGAGAVPGTRVILGGSAYHADGRRYVTTDAVAASDAFLQDLRLRTDGALRILTTAVVATDQPNGGWLCATTGEARMSVT
jgi:hypothetical protein